MAHIIKKIFKVGCLGLVGAFFVAFTVHAPHMRLSEARATSMGTHADFLDPNVLFDRDSLDAFYAARDNRPLWWRGMGNFQPRVEALLALFENSWQHGLNPEHYHIKTLQTMLKAADFDALTFDRLLSDAVIRYARDLTGVRGYHQSPEGAAKYWREPLPPFEILEKMAGAANPVRQLESLAPSGTLYRALQNELLMAMDEAHKDHEPLVIRAGLKPGQAHAGIPALRRKMGLDAASPEAEDKYDDALASKIMNFQRRHAQKPDGVLRAETLAALNRSPKERILQIASNMERLRWMEQGRPERYVLVNIPSATLWAVEDAKVALEMAVIVGKTARPTYSFRTDITGVRFNPNWTVPPTIKRKDFLPLLQEDPHALAKRGIRIRYQGREIDPKSVDWGNISGKSLANLSMVQDPGDENPLGKVRIIMENPYNIYLHDTNNRALFEQDERTLSSGCIRVSEPEKLAEFILKNNADWNEGRAKNLIEAGRMRDVPVENPLPVYITYQTMWLNAEGGLVYGPDVYGMDKKLGDILVKKQGIHIIQAFENKKISL